MDEETEVQSSFLPNTNIQYIWSSNSIGLLKTCARLYQYQKIEGWRPVDESVHLRFGSEYHQALQDYDASRNHGIDHDDSVHDVVRELLIRTGDWRPDHKYKNRNNLVRTVIWYLEKFKVDPATTFIMSNGKPATELEFKFELDYGPVEGTSYVLYGYIDRVVEYMGAKFVMDRKTTKSQPSEFYFSQYEPDNQMSLYTLAGQITLNTPIRGIIIDAAQVLIDWSEYGRGMTYRTPDQINEWLDDLKYWLGQAKDFAEKNYWPMNDKSCNSYRSEESGNIGCPFRKICAKSPQVREAFLKSDFVKEER